MILNLISLDSYYDTCTKETFDSEIKYPMYWCPSATYVNETSLEWIGDHSDNNTFGLCTTTYIPESNGCPDHYHQVRQL